MQRCGSAPRYSRCPLLAHRGAALRAGAACASFVLEDNDLARPRLGAAHRRRARDDHPDPRRPAVVIACTVIPSRSRPRTARTSAAIPASLSPRLRLRLALPGDRSLPRPPASRPPCLPSPLTALACDGNALPSTARRPLRRRGSSARSSHRPTIAHRGAALRAGAACASCDLEDDNLTRPRLGAARRRRARRNRSIGAELPP